MQAKWCKEHRRDVRQSRMSAAAAEPRPGAGSHEPGDCHGVQLPAGDHWEDEAAAGAQRLGTSCWHCSEVTVRWHFSLCATAFCIVLCCIVRVLCCAAFSFLYLYIHVCYQSRHTRGHRPQIHAYSESGSPKDAHNHIKNFSEKKQKNFIIQKLAYPKLEWVQCRH